MSAPTAEPTGIEQSFTEHQVRANVARDRPTIEVEEDESSFLEEHLTEAQMSQMRAAADFGEYWKHKNTDRIVDSVEGATGLRLNQGAQGIVGAALGIIATLMIGVVILGNIDGFADFGANSSWSETQSSVTNQSQQTFEFLNLVPFLLVALFILGLMANRM